MKLSLIRPLCLVASLAVLAPSSEAQVGATEPQSTIITSEGPLQMRNDGVEAYFVMTDNVRLVGTNLEVTCDKLEVFAETEKDPDDPKGFGGISGIRRVVATGHVVVMQEGRRATAGRAEVLPQEDKIELTENPVVTDPQGTLEGSVITIYRGEQHAVAQDPKLTLRALPNLGFPRSPEDEAQAEESTKEESPGEESTTEQTEPAPESPNP